MKIYTLFIEDDRYSVPTLLSIERADDIGAQAYTIELLDKSAHYKAVEIWDGERHVSRETRPDTLRAEG